MAITGFGRSKDEASGGGVSTTPKAGPSASSHLTAFIDQGSEFEGKLSFKDTVRIDGRFQGEITSENTLIVGESGEIEATIRSKSVVVSGVVSGDVIAARQVVLHKTARMSGNIETPSIIVEEGAVFNGKLTMNRPEAKAAASPKSVQGRGPGDSKQGPRPA